MSEQVTPGGEGPGPPLAKRRKLALAGMLIPSITLEGVCIYMLLASEDPAACMPLFLASHGVATLLVSLGTRAWLPTTLRATPWRALLLLWSLTFFIPAVGVLGVLLVLLPALHRAGVEEELPWKATEFPELPAAPFKVSAQPMYIAVGLVGVLRHAPDPGLRLKAVMASRQMPDRLAIPILDIALKDQEDDVRLLAYSMLDGKERVIFDRIKELSKRLEDAPADMGPEGALLHVRLAQEFWELAYLGIAHGKVLLHVLGQAEEHLDAALALRPDDAGTHLLMGRIRLKRGEAELAGHSFRSAVRAGMPDEVTAPFMAEVAFSQRDFEGVREHLASLSPSAASKSPMAEVVRFWCGEG